jgi:peptidoglycan/LPS O-acetylase OafA/YrhL
MKAIIERSQRFLERPLGIGPRLVLFAGALLLIPTHVPPLRGEGGPEPRWIPFAFGVLALLFLRAAVHGKVRDLVDVSVLSVYFAVFLVWTSTPTADFWGLVIVLFLIAAAFVMAKGQAHSEDVADSRLAG